LFDVDDEEAAANIAILHSILLSLKILKIDNEYEKRFHETSREEDSSSSESDNDNDSKSC
jgi:hypothetical protein